MASLLPIRKLGYKVILWFSFVLLFDMPITGFGVHPPIIIWPHLVLLLGRVWLFDWWLQFDHLLLYVALRWIFCLFGALHTIPKRGCSKIMFHCLKLVCVVLQIGRWFVSKIIWSCYDLWLWPMVSPRPTWWNNLLWLLRTWPSQVLLGMVQRCLFPIE